MRDIAKSIEAWFADHEGDGEFECQPRAAPYTVIGPAPDTQQCIFTTKPSIVTAALHNMPIPADVYIVGRYGLPSRADAGWISKLVGRRFLFFVGDMDPVELMVFAWLRKRLRVKDLSYLGVSDTLLQRVHANPSELPCIPLSLSEQKSLGFLEGVFSDFRDVVGKECTGVLKRGHKIELEAVASTKRGAASILCYD